MIISNAKKDDAGDWKFDLSLSDTEVDFLVNVSVHSLLKIGVISIQEQTEPQTVEVLKSQNAPASFSLN